MINIAQSITSIKNTIQIFNKSNILKENKFLIKINICTHFIIIILCGIS